jgi:hypothetical protein
MASIQVVLFGVSVGQWLIPRIAQRRADTPKSGERGSAIMVATVASTNSGIHMGSEHNTKQGLSRNSSDCCRNALSTKRVGLCRSPFVG